MIRSSVNLDCFISVSLEVTDSTHFWRRFRGSGHGESLATRHSESEALSSHAGMGGAILQPKIDIRSKCQTGNNLCPSRITSTSKRPAWAQPIRS
jgi:hypothetical protein